MKLIRLAGAALTLVILASFTPARAATVSLARVHMAREPGANKAAVYAFPSGTRTVYFDYTVSAPYASDTGEIAVYAGGITGTPVAKAPLIFDLSAALYAPVQPASGAFPDGGYCTVLLIDGQPDPDGDRMPIGWTVGKGSLPVACSKKLELTSTRITHAHHTVSISLTVADNRHRPVGGAAVRLDGHAVGLARVLAAKANGKGVVAFTGLQPKRAGTVVLTASKPGYRGGKRSLSIHP